MNHLQLQLRGFHLTTAEIIYRLPDYPDLLQSYVWQEYDQVPGFPVLRGFLEYWHRNLDGKLYAVTLACVDDIRVPMVVPIDDMLRLH